MPGLTRHFAAWHYTHTSLPLTLQVPGQVVGVPATANTCKHSSIKATMLAFVDTAHFTL